MQRAAWQLCYTDASVTAIALGRGWQLQAFAKAFRRHYGCTPGRFAATRARTDTWIARKDTHGKGHSLMLKATHQQGATP
jgi:AraC family transcriptional regulator